MDNIMQQLETWIANVDDPELAAELAQLKAAGNETAIKDAFYQDLAFGTAGLRGIIGAGPNRMNIYTVGKATQGLANYLNANFENPSVAVARDSRNKGELFCQVVAGVLAANGISCSMYPRIEPTPALSFAVRDLQASAGICMTASHNPAPYNGYKVYGPDGCQITTQAAKDIQAAINKVDAFADVKRIPFQEALDSGLARWTGEDTLDRFIAAVETQSLEAGSPETDLSVVYTPLNGTGLECDQRIFEFAQVNNVTLVPEQAQPDGNFPTCPYPNPEIREALAKGLELCETAGTDLLLATDPDADRVGVAVRHNGEYVLVSGNEMGVLLLDYVCRARQARGEDLGRGVAVSTIVSTAMLDQMAADYGFQLRRTLTGFKYIGEQIGLLEAAGQADRYIFGFEESYGYLAGTHVRDKDAIVASLLICQMARYYKGQGQTLVDALEALYAKYGFHKNKTLSFEYPGAAGAQQMAAIMQGFRTNTPAEVAGLKVQNTVDYAECATMPYVGTGLGDAAQTLPAANVFEMQLEGGNKLIMRPSGTEPKVKAYIFATAPTNAEALQVLANMEAAVRELM
ncbi:MAG: phospho-sugar mutase [Coriobacteriia bacterium]|nr:phospho-sugar mutase [Coriobacteriia bacterium]